MIRRSDDTVESLIAEFRGDIASHAGRDAAASDALGIDELMHRLDAELGLVSTATAGGALSRWTSARPELPARQAFALNELLQFDDELFIDTAYRVLLHRLPDPAGRTHYLSALRQGELTRIGVLAALRWSPEGVSRGVHVDGLMLPHWLEKAQCWPLVGPVIGWFRGLARLHTIGQRLETVRQAQAHELQTLGHAHNALVAELAQRLDEARHHSDRQEAQLRALEERAGDAIQRIDALDVAHSHVTAKLESLESRTNMLDASSEQHAVRIEQVQDAARGWVDAMDQAIRLQFSDLSEYCEVVARRVGELEPKVQALDVTRRAQDEAEAITRARQRAFDPLYARFEHRFRGEEDVIRKRAEAYLPLVSQPGIGVPDAPVVDVGSGRGEWLDVLRAGGLHAFGIDINHDFVAECRARGLAVTESDALAALVALPDASAGAITSMHLVEHLPFEVMVEMIDQAHRVLKPGGVLILETPNPENVNVGTHWFYLDPTHRNPLPPSMLAWLVSDRGFTDVEVRGQSEHRSFEAPELLAGDVVGAPQLNMVLAGYRAAPDYAVIAWRK